MFRLSPDDLAADKPVPEPLLAIEATKLNKPLSAVIQLPGGLIAMTSGQGTKPIVVYDPQEQDKRFRFLLSPGDMASAPGAFAGGVLVPCINGQVHLLDPNSFHDLAKPFEPPVKGVDFWEWRAPVAAGDNLAVLCDGDKRLFALAIEAATIRRSFLRRPPRRRNRWFSHWRCSGSRCSSSMPPASC